MKAIIALLIVLFLVLQYKLWFAKGGAFDAWHLKKELAVEQNKNNVLRQRNAIIKVDINALKNNGSAIEERARTDLGMIKQGETYYQVVS